MKIIWKDGYDRESVAERLVAEGIRYESDAKIMVEALRAACKGDDSQWYIIVSDNHRLWRGMADIVGDETAP